MGAGVVSAGNRKVENFDQTKSETLQASENPKGGDIVLQAAELDTTRTFHIAFPRQVLVTHFSIYY